MFLYWQCHILTLWLTRPEYSCRRSRAFPSLSLDPLPLLGRPIVGVAAVLLVRLIFVPVLAAGDHLERLRQERLGRHGRNYGKHQGQRLNFKTLLYFLIYLAFSASVAADACLACLRLRFAKLGAREGGSFVRFFVKPLIYELWEIHASEFRMSICLTLIRERLSWANLWSITTYNKTLLEISRAYTRMV